MDRQITRSIRIAAPVERVWAATADVTRWPDWASTFTSVHQLDGNGLQVGARFRVKQPLQPATIWEVTELVDGKRFSWRSERRVLSWVASHELTETAQQETSVALHLARIIHEAGFAGREGLFLSSAGECARAGRASERSLQTGF